MNTLKLKGTLARNDSWGEQPSDIKLNMWYEYNPINNIHVHCNNPLTLKRENENLAVEDRMKCDHLTLSI